MSVPGSAHLVLASGVVHLDEASAVFEAMLSGWGRQQASRLLAAEATIEPRLALVRRFAEFAGGASVGLDCRRCRRLHGRFDVGPGTQSTVDHSRLSHVVADVLRLPTR